jgi:hypothetical protein
VRTGRIASPAKHGFAGRNVARNRRTFINGVRRGNFLLHPVEHPNVSNGCIKVAHRAQFDRLPAYLRSQKAEKVPGTNTDYYR